MDRGIDNKIIELLRKTPGIDKFQIAKEIKLDLVTAQLILSKLQEQNKITSGLKKDETASIFERRYFSI